MRFVGILILFAVAGVAPSALAAPTDLLGTNTPVPFTVTPTNVSWGDTVSVQGTIINTGSTNSGSFNVAFYLTTNKTIGGVGDFFLGQWRCISGVNPLTTTNYFVDDGNYDNCCYYPTNIGYLSTSWTFTLPLASPVAGSSTNFTIGMYIDVGNEVAESKKTNNYNFKTNYDLASIIINPCPPHISAISSTSPYTNNTVNFGSIAALTNSQAVQGLTIANRGKAPLLIRGIGQTGGSSFKVTQIINSLGNIVVPIGSLATNPVAITPYSSQLLTITLQFGPGTTTGAANGTLAITNNDPAHPVLSISLSGTGVATPQIALVSPATPVDFGAQVNDGTGNYKTIRDIVIRNNGSGTLTVNRYGISLLAGTQFKTNSITSNPHGTINLSSGSKTIDPKGAETWDIKVNFDPSAFGALTDTLQILSNDPNQPTLSIPVQGQGVTAAQLVVSDASGVISNRAEVFPPVAADGSGQSQAVTNIMLQNYGQMPLIVAKNGLTFTNGTQFHIGGIVSDQAGVINLLTNAAQIAGSTQETWTVSLVFVPTVGVVVTDRFSVIVSNLATMTTNVAATVPLSGQGIATPWLAVSNSTSPTNNLVVNFGTILNNGLNNAPATPTVTLWNRGVQPIVIAQNGIAISGGAGFSITSVYSSKSGNINLASSSPSARTISTNSTEIWTITLSFNPPADGSNSATMAISSNDPQSPNTQVALSCFRATLAITPLTPATSLNVSAGSVYNLTWQTGYPVTNATISLYLDTDLNPASGLVPIVTGLLNGAGNSYAWQINPSLAGGNYYVYATITDGGTTRGNYAAGKLRIDPVAAFQLLSGIVTTNASYTYQYVYNGQTYTGTNQLVPGANVVTVTNSQGTNQFVVTLVPTLAQVDAVQYNQLNQIVCTTNGNGIVTTLTYDPLGRLVRRQSSNGAVVTYTYDALGNRLSMSDYTGTTFYSWDALNRLTNVITSKSGVKGGGDNLSLSYEYDLAGHETAIAYPGGERIQYTYDNAGRILTVNNVTRSLLFQYTYNPVTGQLTKLTRPNGIETDCNYDGMGRLTNILHKVTSSGVLVAQYGYVLDAIGKATLLTTTLPSGTRLEHYGYDYFDRLTNVVYADNGVISANSLNVSYAYDGNGNRLTITTKTNNAVTEIRYYTYGNENRLLTVTNQAGLQLNAYTYDPAGNRIQKVATNNTTFYTYDERNLMTSYVDKTNQIAYTCNGDAQRVSQTLNGALTTYVIDANRSLFEVMQERNGSTVTASYTFGATRLATWNSSAVTFELTDRLGSVRMVTDTSGNVIHNYNYDVFGANR